MEINLNFIFLILALLSNVFVKAFNPIDFGYKCDEAYTSNITIGQNITACLHLADLKFRQAFKIEVDKYSVLSLTGGISFILI